MMYLKNKNVRKLRPDEATAKRLWGKLTIEKLTILV
jgi:hypothetical protein